MKSYILFILLQSGYMHSMEFTSYNDCVTAQSEIQTMLDTHRGKSQCLDKGSVLADSYDKTKGAFGAWLKEQSDKYNKQ